MALGSAAISTASVASSYPRSQIGTSLLRTHGLKTTTTVISNLRRRKSFVSLKSVASARSSAVLEKPVSATNLYTLLGLDLDVSLPEIKSAYRKMALKYHPDVCSVSQREESTRMFLQVQDAYEQLSDPRRREQYDYELLCQEIWRPSTSSRRIQRSDSFSKLWRPQWEQQLRNLEEKQAGSQFSESWGARMRRTHAK